MQTTKGGNKERIMAYEKIIRNVKKGTQQKLGIRT